MAREKITISISVSEFPYLEEWLLDKIGKRFDSKFKVIHKDKEDRFMNVQIDLENGIACYLLGIAESLSPLSLFVEKKTAKK